MFEIIELYDELKKNKFRIIIDENNEYWFVLLDILDYANYFKSYSVSNFALIVPNKYKKLFELETRKGKKKTLCVSDFGIEHHLGYSSKPKLKSFQKLLREKLLTDILKIKKQKMES